MSHKEFEELARQEAKKSKCAVRQVGAILVSKAGQILSVGHNYSTRCSCSADTVACASDVVHAEVACLEEVNAKFSLGDQFSGGYTMYITQPPCNKCLAAIKQAQNRFGIEIDIHVCEAFLKFDDDKDRFDLIPPEWELALAKVLTHGANKYKPNNWRGGDVDRILGALKRHINALQLGEELDPDSGFPHTWHIHTNSGFLITLLEGKAHKPNIGEK